MKKPPPDDRSGRYRQMLRQKKWTEEMQHRLDKDPVLAGALFDIFLTALYNNKGLWPVENACRQHVLQAGLGPKKQMQWIGTKVQKYAG